LSLSIALSPSKIIGRGRKREDPHRFGNLRQKVWHRVRLAIAVQYNLPYSAEVFAAGFKI
jgi:hypothetical protein